MKVLPRLLAVAGVAAGLVFPCPAAPEDKAEKKLRIVVFGAHPDDPESGCGGLIARLTGNGDEVIVGYATWFRGETRSVTSPKPRFAAARRPPPARSSGPSRTSSTTLTRNSRPMQADARSRCRLAELGEAGRRGHALAARHPSEPSRHQFPGLAVLLAEKSWNLYFFEVMTDQQTHAFRPELYLDIEGVRPLKRRAWIVTRARSPMRSGRSTRRCTTAAAGKCGVAHAEAYMLLGRPKNGRLLPVAFLQRKPRHRQTP